MTENPFKIIFINYLQNQVGLELSKDLCQLCAIMSLRKRNVSFLGYENNKRNSKGSLVLE